MIIYFSILLLSFLSAELINPENNSSISYTHVLFEWEQIADAVDYELQVNDGNQVVFSVIQSSLIYIDTDHLNWDTQYYWTVRPIFSSGVTGPWSSDKTFTILNSVANPSITLYNSDTYQDGITLLGALEGNFSAAFDKNGNEVWNTQDNNIIIYNTNFKGELYGCYFNPQLENSYPGIEFDINSNYIWEEPNDQFLHHDLLRLPDGNYIGIVETEMLGPIPQDGPWYEYCYTDLGYGSNCDNNILPWIGDKLIIWDEDSREPIWEWNVFDYYDISDYDGVYYNEGIYGGTWNTTFGDWKYDWTHINAITYNVEQSAIYISCRHLSRITKIYFNFSDYSDPNNGYIVWNLGQEMPSGDVDCGYDINFSWQHTISSLDNGNVIHLDNGNLSDDFNNDLDDPISRAIEINPNETADGCNAEIVWEYNLDENLFGHSSGGVQKLDNGNYLISTVGDFGTTLEISNDMDLVWDAKYNLTAGLIYRTYRVSSLYPVEASVIAPGYRSIDYLSDSVPGIYVSFQDSVRSNFIIYNNGSVDEDFVYSFESIGENGEDIWYPYSEHQIQINAGESKVVTLAGHFNSSDEGGLDYNNIEMTLRSENNHNFNKTYNFTMYATWDDLSNNIVDDSFKIINAYPNPFNPSAFIEIQVKEMISSADVNIYDLNGKFIENIYSGFLNPGEYNFTWTPQNLASGKYFISFESVEVTSVKELIYIK